jgi:small subunit ribosomal protein S6
LRVARTRNALQAPRARSRDLEAMTASALSSTARNRGESQALVLNGSLLSLVGIAFHGPRRKTKAQEGETALNATHPPSAERPQGPVGSPAHLHVREYETIYILRFDIDSETAERVQARVNDAVDREQGKLVKVEAWGRRRLAYSLGKQRRGVYVYLKYVGGGNLVAEVERNLKLQDAVVKFMTVKTSDEVDLGALQIDPEETRLGKLELPSEDEKEESREKELGLIDPGPDAPRRPPEEGEEFEAGEEEGEDLAPKRSREGGEEEEG